MTIPIISEKLPLGRRGMGSTLPEVCLLWSVRIRMRQRQRWSSNLRILKRRGGDCRFERAAESCTQHPASLLVFDLQYIQYQTLTTWPIDSLGLRMKLETWPIDPLGLRIKPA